MIRLLVSGILCLFLALPGLYADDNKGSDQPEPPVRLKKKAKATDEPQAGEKKLKSKLKDKAGKEDGEPADTEPEKDFQKIVTRIAKNMKESQDRLAKKDPGDGTRQIQRDIVKDIDSLIDQKKRQQQQQQDQQNSQSSSSRQQASQRQKGSRQQQQGNQTRQKSRPQEASANNPGGGGNKRKEGMGRDADLFKDIWGHLPETLRKEMDAYSRVEFMMKYNDLLKQYYTTIAEKGRRKGE